MSTSETESKPETKTVAATWGAFLASGVALTVLQSLDLNGLPQWLAVPAGMVATSAVTFLLAYNTKHKPSKLSWSALQALARR